MAEIEKASDLAAGIAGQRVLVTAGRRRHRPRHRRAPVTARRAGLRLRRRRRGPRRVRPRFPQAGRIKADVSDEARCRPPVRRGRDSTRRPRRADQQCRHRRADRRRRRDRPGRLAPLHRRLPDRPVPLRAPRRADAEGGGRRLDRQHVLGRRPARLRLPHALFGGEVRRHRLHPEPRQGARARTTSGSTRSCPASSRGRAWRA